MFWGIIKTADQQDTYKACIAIIVTSVVIFISNKKKKMLLWVLELKQAQVLELLKLK